MHRSDRRSTAIFSDFNGTITDKDTLPTLLEAYGLHDVVKRTNDARGEGLLSHREQIAAQARALTQSIEAASARLSALVGFDMGFRRLQVACMNSDVTLTILSSGIEQLIKPLLRRHGCEAVTVIANGVVPRADGWRVQFRDASPQGCSKRSYLLRARRDGWQTVAIGDDESDFEMATFADLCFAKRESALQKYLYGVGRAHYTYVNLDDVVEYLVLTGVLLA